MKEDGRDILILILNIIIKYFNLYIYIYKGIRFIIDK